MPFNVYLPIVKGLALNLAYFQMLKQHPEQQRKAMAWDDCLVTAAGVRATQAAKEWSHCFQGDCTNRVVRRYCSLPPEYPENGNSIESLVGGVENPESALNALLRSPRHADHLLGRTEFFRQQTRCGIAFHLAEDSQYRFYYVILISR